MNIQKARAAYDNQPLYNPPINLQRGVLHKRQLDLSRLYRYAKGPYDVDGEDVRNYGRYADGLPEARTMFAEYLGVDYDEIIVYERTARSVFYDLLNRACFQGIPGYTPWLRGKSEGALVCPAPGYDNHFSICKDIGIPMLRIPMREDGPDIGRVESLCGYLQRAKGIVWHPWYHNPTGVTFSLDATRRLARMKAAPDFRIFCDCTYLGYGFADTAEPVINLLEECKNAGVPDRPLLFFSTSKITHPSQAVAGVAGSVNNMEWVRGLVRAKMTVPDLVNQLQHARLFKTAGGIHAVLRTQAKIIKPKLTAIDQTLKKWFGSAGDVIWRMPKGGYCFMVTLSLPCASRAVQLAKEKGILLLEPRNMYPDEIDMENRHIRIMPTGTDEKMVEKGMEILCASMQYALAEKEA